MHAFNPEEGVFRNFMGYDRRWLERAGSEDSHARAVWGLGETVAAVTEGDERRLARELLRRALPAVEQLEATRAVAHALLGITAYLQVSPEDEVAQPLLRKTSNRLYKQYRQTASSDWPWIEDELTYANGTIPHALLAAGSALEASDLQEAGLKALDWLVDLQTEHGRYVPVGNHGWYPRGGERARFDQQPIEAASMIPACIEAHRLTGDRRWLTEAQRCFRWFTGENDLGVPVYDEATGACCDGLRPDGLNQNRGAESTLAWLYSLILMHTVQSEGTFGWADGAGVNGAVIDYDENDKQNETHAAL
ncbi:MAG: hypothetical protein ACE5HE_03600 [Phycisphaerae bacterium]